MLLRLQKLLGITSNTPTPAIIITGIAMPSYTLAKELMQRKIATPCAFIDDQPWTNRTQILGVTIHYPSDLAALVKRQHVAIVVRFDHDITIANTIWQEVEKTGVQQIEIPNTASLGWQLKAIMETLKTN
ncbi:hypothetical protein GCM10025791_01950 [Halioxenophilus aromaticivorans]|uniref:DUF2325 domain-containing protein n=2 Tax=Halioxenophilus aromaticivorans TaxID=1306992 RepID=A0AAV3TWT3_9ALTE